MTKRLVIFGGSFDPPGIHHVLIAFYLSAHYDDVVVLPCGQRPDQKLADGRHRAMMVESAFNGIHGVRVDDTDVRKPTFERMCETIERLRPQGDLTIFVGDDLLTSADGRMPIRDSWKDGARLWQKEKFAILPRLHSATRLTDIPPRSTVYGYMVTGSSTKIRECIRDGIGFHHLVPRTVADHIERHGLYLDRQQQVRLVS